MDLLLREELRVLMKEHEEPCISIYLPTHRAGKGVTLNSARFKSALSTVEKRLLEMGRSSQSVGKMLAPAKELLKNISFWRHQSGGLAAFISLQLFRYYTLPVEFKELVLVTRRFHLKPVIQLMAGDGRFYLLALSQNATRLLHGTRYSVDEIDLETLPRNLSDALCDEVVPKQYQFHTGTPGATGGGDAIFHGAGNEPDYKDAILRYFQKIDRALHELLREEKAPLVLAGVEYLFPIYRQANTYPHLVGEGVTGNPELLSPKELHDRAWDIVFPVFEREEKEAAARFNQLAEAGSPLATSNLEEAVREAYNGRIDFLFVPVGVHRWGAFDPEAGQVRLDEEPVPGNEDLLDLAATYTLSNGGAVYALEPDRMPRGLAVAAVYRY